MDFFIKNSKNTIFIESNFVEEIMVQNTQSMPDVAKDDEIDLLAIAKILWTRKWSVVLFSFFLYMWKSYPLPLLNPKLSYQSIF